MFILKKVRFFLLIAVIIPTLSWAGDGQMTTKYFPQKGETRTLCILDTGEKSGIALPPAGGVDIKNFSKMDMNQKKDFILYLYTPPADGHDTCADNTNSDPNQVIVGSTWFTPHNNNGIVTVDLGNIYTDGSMEINPNPSSYPINGVTEIDFTYSK